MTTMKKLKKIVIIASILTIGHYFHASYTDGSDMLQSSIFSNLQSSSEQMFQPADGSLSNGTYDKTTHNAKTKLHSYQNVITIDGTTATPTLNAQGKYVDITGNQLEPIGSFNKYSDDSGDINTYYLFGNITDKENLINNGPIETYSSQTE